MYMTYAAHVVVRMVDVRHVARVSKGSPGEERALLLHPAEYAVVILVTMTPGNRTLVKEFVLGRAFLALDHLALPLMRAVVRWGAVLEGFFERDLPLTGSSGRAARETVAAGNHESSWKRRNWRYVGWEIHRSTTRRSEAAAK